MLQDSGDIVAAEVVKDTTTQGFMKDVIEESKHQPVLVDFWAPWCGPCKQLTPVLEKTVKAAKGKVKLAKMNIDEHPAIPGQMGIQSIPAVIAFSNGQPVDGFMGALPEGQVTAFLERITKGAVGAEEKDLLKAADAALAEGNATGAADMYAQLLAEDSGNVPALAGLARCYVQTGALEQAKQTLALIPEAKRNEAAVATARAALEVAEQAKSIGPLEDLEKRLLADPLDHQARFDLAVALNANGKREDAVKHLIDIIKRDRKWNDDGARKQLVQFFEAWGGTDPATLDGRKRLSSILFSWAFRPGGGTAWRSKAKMPMNAQYRGPIEMPGVIPVFPLPGALLLPRGQMPLNIFEPRYLAMVDDALRDGHRLIGMIQPDAANASSDKPSLYKIGCVGRITQLAES